MGKAIKYAVVLCVLAMCFKSNAQVSVNENTLPLFIKWITIARDQGDREKAIKYYESILDYGLKSNNASQKAEVAYIGRKDLDFIMESYSLKSPDVARKKIREHLELYWEALDRKYGRDPANTECIINKSAYFIDGALLSRAAGLDEDVIFYDTQRVRYLEENGLINNKEYFDALSSLACSYQAQKNDIYSAVMVYKKAFFAALQHFGPESQIVQDLFNKMAACERVGVMNITLMAGKADEYIFAEESTSITEINKVNELWISILKNVIDRYGINYYNALISRHQEIFQQRPQYEDNPYASSLYEAYSFKSDVLIASKEFSSLLVFLESEISKLNYLTIPERTKLYIHAADMLRQYRYYDVAISVLEQRINDMDIPEEDCEYLAAELISLFSTTGNTQLLSYAQYFLLPIYNGIINIHNPNTYINALAALIGIFGKLNTPEALDRINQIGEVAYEVSKGKLPKAYINKSNAKVLDSALKKTAIKPISRYIATRTYADVKSAANCLNEAELLYKEAIQIDQENHLFKNNYTRQLDLAQIYAKEHKKELVDKIVNDILAQNISEQDELSIYDKISACYWTLGDYHTMKQYMARYTQLATWEYISTALYMTKEKRMALSWIKSIDSIVPFAGYLCKQAGDDYNDYCYNVLLNHKGLQFSLNEIIKEDVIKSNDTALIESYRKYKEAEKSDSELTGTYEKDFIQNYGFSFSEQGLRKFRTWQDVRDKLQDGDIAVEFTLSASDKYKTGVYAALVLTKDIDMPLYIELCPRDNIDNLNIDDIVTSIENGELYNNIWAPILAKIQEPSTIFFAPYGSLNNIPLEYLDKSENTLSKKNYIRVSSTGKLPSLKNPFQYTSATLYGGMEYDADISNVISSAKNISISQVISDSSLTRKGWDYLPGTKREVEKIASILVQHQIQAKTHVGKDGTETSFKELSGDKNDIIHIATHGFYLSNASDLTLADSGLLFTGGQNGWRGDYTLTGHDDGILLSKEIAGMDLSDTDIVVLSACETALGGISLDEVYGLQRAFKIAGVESIIMSLWEVDDEATETMMISFYTNLMHGLEKHNAFSNAIETVKTKYKSPFYWASFIMLD